MGYYLQESYQDQSAPKKGTRRFFLAAPVFDPENFSQVALTQRQTPLENEKSALGLGLFLQTDPIRFSAGDVNIYRYCGNRANTHTDAFGLDDKKKKEEEEKEKEKEKKKEEEGGYTVDDIERGLNAVISDPSLLNPTSEIGNQAWQEGAMASLQMSLAFAGGARALAAAGRGLGPGNLINSNRFIRFGDSGAGRVPTMRIGNSRPSPDNHFPLTVGGK